jgi:hypothetical protein
VFFISSISFWFCLWVFICSCKPSTVFTDSLARLWTGFWPVYIWSCHLLKPCFVFRMPCKFWLKLDMIYW